MLHAYMTWQLVNVGWNGIDNAGSYKSIDEKNLPALLKAYKDRNYSRGEKMPEAYDPNLEADSEYEALAWKGLLRNTDSFGNLKKQNYNRWTTISSIIVILKLKKYQIIQKLIFSDQRVANKYYFEDDNGGVSVKAQKNPVYEYVNIYGQEGMTDKAYFARGETIYLDILKDFEKEFKKVNKGYPDYYRMYVLPGGVKAKKFICFLNTKNSVPEEDIKKKRVRVLQIKRNFRSCSY
ncbi:hypothetical protein FQR65_LT18626 [Abscondita terminalis]|nr:hypothetical protein FQR65_LT18626 [Abscondita terminalis]